MPTILFLFSSCQVNYPDSSLFDAWWHVEQIEEFEQLERDQSVPFCILLDSNGDLLIASSLGLYDAYQWEPTHYYNQLKVDNLGELSFEKIANGWKISIILNSLISVVETSGYLYGCDSADDIETALIR